MFFSEKETRTIEAAVTEAESHTSAELVVVAVDRSGSYRWVGGLLALVATASVSATLFLWNGLRGWEPLSAVALAEVQILTALGAYLLGSWGPVLRWVVPRKEQETRVQREALARFVTEGVATTEGRTGILIYLSQLEHQVRILTDTHVAHVMPKELWETEAAAIARGLGEGRGEAALVGSLHRLGAALGERLPRSADDRNELPNAPQNTSFDKKSTT